ncbi:uncharacterized protein CC84DRAFT_1111081 [Paraphaeosphaeria sporulosa]|uniref:Uncharacterized protein n=1 Tax=Paraphaeosphaeria sporulosa TaxID=1460663 RepID=A0A177CPX6_9PLEO|nr:uncharacterized protein CC84DRAFT_1111081 [Paraphaeosphaeria sporulosa]OAG09573.1 hypothetical protein CC84DRAFT_1111081 [Paraphaeosphaeria sporulosa]
MSNPLPRPEDVYSQEFVLYAPDGSQFTISMVEIDWLRHFGVRIAINWATQIGASVTLLLVLLLLTRRDKRKSSIFIMNALCLVLNAIRSILQCVYLTTPYFHPYAVIANDYTRVTPAHRAISVVSNTITLILVVSILVSLSLQVWVVCITAKPLQKWIIMGGTSLTAIVAIGYRFAVMSISNKQTMKDESMEAYDGLVNDMYITFAVAVWAYCAVFTFKLGHALLERKRLRMTQFGPMQIIFIMAIFTCLNFYDAVPELASQSITVICIFLPLSAIWAGLVASDSSVGSSGPDSHQRLFKNEFARSSSTTYGDRSHLTGNTFGSGKEPENPRGHHYHQTKDSVDNGIYMQKEWHVEAAEGGQPSDIVRTV